MFGLRYRVRASRLAAWQGWLLAVCVVIAAWCVVLPTAQASADPIAQQIADPAYINPTASPSTWDHLIGSTHGTVGIAVANVLNGPDYEAHSDWASVISRAHDAGIKVLGYVDTGYFGTTSPGSPTRLGSTATHDWISQVEQDIDAWYRFYGSDMGGIFFDEAQNDCTYAPLYQAIDDYVKRYHPGALTVENPGIGVPQCFQNTADVIVTYEGSYADYTADPSSDPNAYQPLSWTPVDPNKIWHIVYGASSQSDMENAVSLSKSRGAGYVFVTNDTLPNPYDTLPPTSYWSDEQTQIAPGSSLGTTAPSVPSDLTSGSIGGTQASLNWGASTAGSAPLAGYDVYENGAYLASVPSGTTTYTATNLNPATSYSFTIDARDEAANTSAQTTALAVTTAAADSTTPSTPGSLSAGSTTYTSTTLSWSASSDSDESVTHYLISDGGTQVLDVPATMTSATVGGLSPGTSHTFTVTAEGQSGALSSASSGVSVSLSSLPGGAEIGSPVFGTSGGNITFSADFYVPFGFRHVYIATGTEPCWYTGSTPQICADYMIENTTLEAYVGDGTSYDWTPIATVAPVVSGYSWNWTIPLSDLGSPAEEGVEFNGDGFNPDIYTHPSAVAVAGHTGPTLPNETTGGQNLSEIPCDTCGNGVDSPTGEFSQNVTDLAVPGRGLSLSLDRSYSSTQAGTDGPFGYGWTSSYNMAVYADPNVGDSVMDVRQENGSVDEFFQQSDGTWQAASRVLATLAHNSDGTWTFTRQKGTIYQFNSNGHLTSETDLDGNTTSLGYSGSHLATVTDPAGRTLSFTYTGDLVTGVTDSAGRTTSYAYDGSDNLIHATDVNGKVTTYAYDGNHLMTAVTKPEGGVTHNTYDSHGRLASQTDPDGYTTTWSYSINAATLTGTSTITDPEGIVTQDTWTNGDLTAQTVAYGTSSAATATYTYDPTTNGETSVTDPNGHTTTYTYDTSGNKLTETNPTGDTTTWTYNGYDEVTSMTPPATYGGQHAATTYAYDESAYSSGGVGNLTTVSTPIYSPSGSSEGTQVTHYVHGDSAHPGDVTSMVDPRGNTWTYTYDAEGDKTSETAPATSDNSDSSGSHQNVTRWAYDTDTGWATSEMTGRYTLAHPSATSCTTPAAGCTTYTYDASGRRLTVTDGNGHTTTTAYDGDGNVASMTDAAGHTTTYGYDPADQRTTTTLPDASVSTTQYTADGQVEKQTDANGNATSYTYDDLGNKTSVTDPNNRTTNYLYDGAGNMLVKADPGVSGCTATSSTDGCTTYAYDADNRQTAIHYNDSNTPDVSFSYDADGRRTQMGDGTGTSSWSYNSLGKVESTTNGAGATTRYAYDPSSNVTSITYPGSTGTVGRTFDAAGRISAITDWKGNATAFAYDADGNLTTTTDPTTGTAVTDTATYDSAGAPSAISVAGASTIASFDYTRDASNRITAVSSTGVPSDNHTYTYNSVGELTGVDNTSYTYDAALRPTKLANGATQTYDPAGELTSVGSGYTTAAFTYDPKGERTSSGLVAPGYLPNTYTYNQAGELATAKTSPAAPDAYVSNVLGDHPAGFWSLGEASGTTAADTSGNGHDGTYSGGVSLAQPGGLAGDSATSTHFDGSTGTVAISTPGLPTSSGTDVAVEFWMYWDGTSYSAMPFGWGGYDLWLANGTSGSFGFNSGSGDLYGISAQGLAKRWVHVTAIFHNGDATQSQLYIDGVKQTLSQQIGTTGSATVGSTADISGTPWSSSYFKFDGRIQDVAIYSSALTQSQITTHYDAGNAVSGYANNVMADSPSGFWPLGEASGTTAHDASGNTNDGTYSGTVSLGQSGALAGDPATSAGFDGSTGTVAISTPGLPTASGSDVTVEFWMYWNGTSYSAMPFGWGAYDLWLANGQTGSFGFNTGSGDLYGISAAGLANHWVHVTAIFHNGDATQSQLYINGVKQTLSQQIGTTGSASVGTTANISGFPGSSSYFRFDGRIQGVAIYPYALGQDRITAHYDAGTVSNYAKTASYTYDGNGLRATKTVNGTTQHFVWGSQPSSNPVMISDGSTSYLYGPDGTPLEQMDSGGNVLWYHHDANGSTRLLTDGTGTVVGTATYGADGQVTATTGTTTPLGYDGQYVDAETGFIYLRARYYDPQTDQFITSDPLTSVTAQPYSYAADDPLNQADPSGYLHICNVGAATAMRVGLELMAGGVSAELAGEIPYIGAVMEVVGISAEALGEDLYNAGWVATLESDYLPNRKHIAYRPAVDIDIHFKWGFIPYVAMYAEAHLAEGSQYYGSFGTAPWAPKKKKRK